jgi:ABC-type Mn2+/Zn2+ transport system permease subunit
VLASIVLGIGIAFLGTFLVKKGISLWETRKQAA